MGVGLAQMKSQSPFIMSDESRLEGVDMRKLKFTTLNTLQAGVSVRIKVKSGIEGKQINQESKANDTVICFTEVRF
jgi:hypothetical protein